MSTRQTITRRSKEWLHSTSVESASRNYACRLLDVRPREGSSQNHLPGSAQLPVAGEHPAEPELPSHMMGEPERPVGVFGDDPGIAENCAVHLAERGFNAAAVEGVPDDDWLEPGPAKGALWKPDSFLAAQVDRIPAPGAGPIVDLGAGNGRDSVFLARRGHDVLMVDKLPDALELAQDRARRHRVHCQVEVTDLRHPEAWDGAGFAAALCIRYLSRPLLRTLHERMLPGSILLYSGYALRDADAPPRHRLSTEEARELIRDDRWQWLVEPQTNERDDELWIQFVARRRRA